MSSSDFARTSLGVVSSMATDSIPGLVLVSLPFAASPATSASSTSVSGLTSSFSRTVRSTVALSPSAAMSTGCIDRV